MIKLFWHLVLVIPFLAQAQGGDSVFIVKAPNELVQLSPNTSIIYRNLNNYFKVVADTVLRADSVAFSLGQARLRNGQLIVKPLKGPTAILKIYRRLPNGKSSIALVKQFEVRSFQEPKPNLDGVCSDSAIYGMKAVAQGFVNVPVSAEEALKRISYPIVSFGMETVTGGAVDTLSTTGNKLTYAMKDKIDKLPDGSVLNITNIRYVVNGDTLTMRQPLRVYIINDKVQKF